MAALVLMLFEHYLKLLLLLETSSADASISEVALRFFFVYTDAKLN